MNARKYPRTLQQAFGPYTSNELHPMRPAKTSNREILLYIAGLLIVLLIVHVVAKYQGV